MTDALWDVELVDEELTIKFDLKPAENIDELLTNVECFDILGIVIERLHNYD